MLSYQSLLGISDLVADIFEANNLIIHKDANIAGDLEVKGQSILHELILPTDAAADYVLKSDVDGKASWVENLVNGDITGNIASTVQHHKWIGNWNDSTEYKQFNRVTHDHIEYRALFDNVGAVPNYEIGSYSLYNEAYPVPSHSTLEPDSLHQEIALRIEPNQRGFLTHFKFYNVSLTSVDIKIYSYPWSVVHEQTSVVGLGWQTIELTSPVPVKARQTILAAMLTNGQPYAYIPQDFDVLLDMDPAVYIGNDGQSTETVFWFAKPGHPSSPGDPPLNGGVFNRTYLIDVIYEVGRTWEVVLDDRPDTVYEEKAQPLHNKTDVDVVDLTVHNQIHYPTGAEVGKVLTCVDSLGVAEWDYPAQISSVTMLGDVTGPSNASVVNTLAGGTIQVSDIVCEETAQPLHNKTDADIGDLVIRNSLKLNLLTLNSGVFNIRYLVGWGDPNFNDCKWINDLYAPIISAQSQLLYPVNASTGKILSCVDGTGLAQWITPPSTTLAGDVTGPSSATVVNTLAGGSIPASSIVLKESLDALKNKVIRDPSNNVLATGLRVGTTWSVELGGSAPSTNQVLSYNGTDARWVSPILGGDVTGSYGATVVNTLAGGT